MKLVIVTDSCSDLPIHFMEENSIYPIPLKFTIDGNTYNDDFGISYSYKKFYDELRSGKTAITACISPYDCQVAFEKFVNDGYTVLFFCISSALSGSFNSAKIALDAVKENYPDADITIYDSKAASLGLGLIIYHVIMMSKAGSSKESIINWLDKNINKVNHWFTVDDLSTLRRGGRISAASATIGTILNIKPMLYMSLEGLLIPLKKVKGRKKSIRELFEFTKENIEGIDQLVAITHGDCLEEANSLKEMLENELGIKSIWIENVGPSIGSHSGPGTIAVFFIGKEKLK